MPVIHKSIACIGAVPLYVKYTSPVKIFVLRKYFERVKNSPFERIRLNDNYDFSENLIRDQT